MYAVAAPNRTVVPVSRQIRRSQTFICSRVGATSAPNGSSINSTPWPVQQRAAQREPLAPPRHENAF
ncbi:hypothetical protein CFP75_00560 [Amycolatopsis alba DSM 44262]|uniref:Uncharacterized protein n=1 Tax=Amycolatopsis alba DSM 44262 TaxID=1125972 RepID=A0A229S9I3_AMYAL|nr:hypothetical protein CFP75_00560 [Amycolatopsis alba DSM 44262]